MLIQKCNFIILTQKVDDKASTLDLFFGHEWCWEKGLKLFLFDSNIVFRWSTTLFCRSICGSITFFSSGIRGFVILESPSQPCWNRHGRHLVIDLFDTVWKRIMLLMIDLIVSGEAKRSIKGNFFILFLYIGRCHIWNIVLGVIFLICCCHSINWFQIMEVTEMVAVKCSKSITNLWYNIDNE